MPFARQTPWPRSPLPGALLALGLLAWPALARAELKVVGQGKDQRLAPEQFPAEHKDRLKLFEAKCSKCHNLDRPITALRTGLTPISQGKFDDAEIKAYVVKMMRKPNSGIEQNDAKEILLLLRFARTLATGG
jgi:mono/diheme cytochrome c family protein